jgi:hypothetical protein
VGDFGFRTFDPGDTDLDGMPDGYELAHSCLNRTVADANGDPDNDGVTSGNEHIAGTNPCVAPSVGGISADPPLGPITASTEAEPGPARLTLGVVALATILAAAAGWHIRRRRMW